MSRIVVVDDEPSVLAAFQELLGSGGYEVATAQNAEAAMAMLMADPCDLVVMDICLSGMDGLEALRQIKQQSPSMPVIVMTGHGTMQTAIEATKLGAFDYHVKPFEPAEMLAAVEKALESARLSRNSVIIDPDVSDVTGEDAIVGRSPGMQQVYMTIGRVASTEATVLVRGESGTGKELVARAIHQHSRRADCPLLVVNCVAIPDTLLESELFGYERGAFTGATGRRIGKFEQANGGTILLDEIGDMPLGIQAKVLRVLQERCFERLGGSETVRVNVRILAATNRNLEKAIAEGLFRDDLYHRLNVVTVQVPPLRERREDIPRLVDYFLRRYAAELNVEKPQVAPDALRKLQDFPWPGNVRQLAHAVQRALIFTKGHPVQAADLLLQPNGEPDHSTTLGLDERLTALIRDYLDHCPEDHALDEFLLKAERQLIVEALSRADGNQTHAARLLGLPRPTLHAKIQKHRLQG